MSVPIISRTDSNFDKTMASILDHAGDISAPVHFEFEDKGDMVLMTHAQLEYLLSGGNRPGVLLPESKRSKK